RTGLASAVRFAGVLVRGLDPSVVGDWQAVLLMLVSALFLAIGTVLLKGLRGLDTFSMQGWTSIIAVFPLLGISAAIEPGGFALLASVSWVAWFGVIYAALISSLLGHGLYYVLMQRYPVAQVTPWLMLTPVIAVGLGIAFWGDRPGVRLFIGGAMVLGGVLGVALRALRKARTMPLARDI